MRRSTSRYSVSESFNGTGPSKKDRYHGTVTTKENTIKKTFAKGFAIPLDFDI